MLKKESENVHAMLVAMNAAPEVSGFFTKFYPLVGDSAAVEPYATYALSQVGSSTKNRLKDYSVDFTIVGINYDQAVDAADHLQSYFENISGMHFQGSTPSYVDEMDRCVITTTYTFKN